MNTCPECRGEGKVKNPKERMLDAIGPFWSEFKVWALGLSFPFVATVIMYGVVRFPLWPLAARINTGGGEAVLWTATILGTIAGVIASLFFLGNHLEQK